MLTTVALGALIRDLRQSRSWSQADLACQLCTEAGRDTLTREDVSRWERGKVIPSRYWLDQLAHTLEAPHGTLVEAANLDRVNRREFLSLAAFTATHGKLAGDMVASVAGSDSGPLTTVQTTHGTDLVIASLVDRPSTVRLRRWMHDGDDPVLRVNSAGILAKLPGQDPASEVAKVLAGDTEAQGLYMTALLARACALDWATASRLAADPLATPTDRVPYVASRLAAEVLNPRDAGARWCSAAMLRDLSPLLR